MIQNDISNKIKNIMAISLIGILLFCISFFYQMQVNASSLLKVYFIDVGQGSAILVQSNDKNTLIDTGDEKYYNKLDAFLSNNQINSIDQIVLTHNDPDHVGNVDRLIKTRKVGTVIQSKYGYKKMLLKKM